MTHAVGSVIKYNGCAYIVVEDKSDRWEDGCGRCVLYGRGCTVYVGIFGECADYVRLDKKNVHFEQYGVDW